MTRNEYTVLVLKPEGKILHRGVRRSWEDNVMVNFKGIECDGVGWIQLSQCGVY